MHEQHCSRVNLIFFPHHSLVCQKWRHYFAGCNVVGIKNIKAMKGLCQNLKSFYDVKKLKKWVQAFPIFYKPSTSVEFKKKTCISVLKNKKFISTMKPICNGRRRILKFKIGKDWTQSKENWIGRFFFSPCLRSLSHTIKLCFLLISFLLCSVTFISINNLNQAKIKSKYTIHFLVDCIHNFFWFRPINANNETSYRVESAASGWVISYRWQGKILKTKDLLHLALVYNKGNFI